MSSVDQRVVRSKSICSSRILLFLLTSSLAVNACGINRMSGSERNGALAKRESNPKRIKYQDDFTISQWEYCDYIDKTCLTPAQKKDYIPCSLIRPLLFSSTCWLADVKQAKDCFQGPYVCSNIEKQARCLTSAVRIECLLATDQEQREKNYQGYNLDDFELRTNDEVANAVCPNLETSCNHSHAYAEWCQKTISGLPEAFSKFDACDNNDKIKYTNCYLKYFSCSPRWLKNVVSCQRNVLSEKCENAIFPDIVLPDF